MLGGTALSSVTPNTCPTSAAFAVNGLFVLAKWASSGPAISLRSTMRREGPAGSMSSVDRPGKSDDGGVSRRKQALGRLRRCRGRHDPDERQDGEHHPD